VGISATKLARGEAMTFNSIGNLISSSDGYSIEFLGREGMRYREGDRSLYVFSEYLIPKGIGIYVKSIERWEPPHNKEEIGTDERERVLSNLAAALSSVGEEAVFGR
jgi:hypothetical protein